MIFAVKHPLAPMTGVVEEGMPLCIENIPSAFDFHGIVGMSVLAVISAEGVSTFEPDSLTHIVSFQ